MFGVLLQLTRLRGPPVLMQVQHRCQRLSVLRATPPTPPSCRACLVPADGHGASPRWFCASGDPPPADTTALSDVQLAAKKHCLPLSPSTCFVAGTADPWFMHDNSKFNVPEPFDHFDPGGVGCACPVCVCVCVCVCHLRFAASLRISRAYLASHLRTTHCVSSYSHLRALPVHDPKYPAGMRTEWISQHGTG